MKSSLLFLSLVSFLIIPSVKCALVNIDRSLYYQAMKSGDLDLVNKQLSLLEKESGDDSRAFEGAMLMKKAGLVKGPFKKLRNFKKGHAMLEDVLKNNASNPEFHFLRLMIQEKAPGLVNYNDDIKADSALIHSSFKNMTQELREIISDYSKISKVLSPGDFKT